MTSYKFNFSVADTVLDHMDSVNSNLRNSLAELEAHCRSSLAEWDGVARESYTAAEAEWRAGAAAMSQALQSGRTSLFNISEGYGSAEQRATQIWQNTYTGR
jgi:WXG100 family type VII secretion target